MTLWKLLAILDKNKELCAGQVLSIKLRLTKKQATRTRKGNISKTRRKQKNALKQSTERAKGTNHLGERSIKFHCTLTSLLLEIMPRPISKS